MDEDTKGQYITTIAMLIISTFLLIFKLVSSAEWLEILKWVLSLYFVKSTAGVTVTKIAEYKLTKERISKDGNSAK